MSYIINMIQQYLSCDAMDIINAYMGIRQDKFILWSNFSRTLTGCEMRGDIHINKNNSKILYISAMFSPDNEFVTKIKSIYQRLLEQKFSSHLKDPFYPNKNGTIRIYIPISQNTEFLAHDDTIIPREILRYVSLR